MQFSNKEVPRYIIGLFYNRIVLCAGKNPIENIVAELDLAVYEISLN